MYRSALLTLVLGFTLTLTACSPNSCESIKERLGEIEQDMEDNPEILMDEDTGRELEELGNKMVELKCFG
jgi:hypothetical protein